MKLINQTNEFECGICVINMLINYFHNVNIEKHEIINKSELTSHGLSIYNFENLAREFKLDVESYKISIKELNKYSSKKPFVCIFKNDLFFHYVIVFKNKKIFTIYDPINGKYDLSIKDFETKYAGIVIFVKKLIKSERIIASKSHCVFKYVRVNDLITIFLINLFLLIINVIGSLFITLIIKYGFNQDSIKNIISLCSIFAFIFLFSIFSNYWLSIITKNKVRKLSHSLLNQFFEILKNKNNDFSEKNDVRKIGSIINIISFISKFIYTEYPNILISIISLLISTILLCVFNYWYCLVLLFSSILLVLINYFKIAYKKNEFNKLFCSSINFEYELLLLSELIKNNNSSLYINKINEIQNQMNDLFRSSKECNIFLNKNFFVKEFFNSFLNIFIVLITSVLILKFNMIDESYLFFIINLFSISFGSVNSICNFIDEKYQYEYFYGEYVSLLEIANEKNKKKLDNIALVSLNNKIIYKNKFNKIASLNELKNNLKINNLYISEYFQKYINSTIIIIDPYAIDKKELIEKCNQDDIAKYLEIINFDNKYESIQILQIISLLKEKDKIIILNDCLRHISKSKLKNVRKILLEVIKKNYLIEVYYEN